jgi:hypothetical protein
MMLQACNTTAESDSASAPAPPDAKAILLAHKAELWKDPDSIKDAAIAAPKRHMNFMWHVCVKANAKNAFGGYTGLKTSVIHIYDSGKAPEARSTVAGDVCDSIAYQPFPELEGDYRTPAAPSQAKAKRS